MGSGASDLSTTSWRARVGKWFVDTFGPESSYGKNVTNVHGAIGATGSYFGSYRVWRDCELGSDNPPDVLFIEFAINDIYDNITQDQTEINYESIIRQAYKANPKIMVIPVFTMDNNIAYNYLNKGHDDSKYFTAQRTIAEYYGLPQVNVGHALIEVINSVYEAEGKTFAASDSSNANSIWRRFIADACHPKDAGYEVYADTVISFLTEQLGDSVSHDAPVKAVDINEFASYASTKGNGAHIKENGRYISFKDAGFTNADLNGWTLSTRDGESSYAESNGSIRTSFNNASFAFKFTGTAVGFFNHGYYNSGTVEYTITSTADPSKSYTGKVSLVKNYQNGGLPFPAELKTGLDNEEWLVEVVLKDVGHGSEGWLKYIYINGDTASIEVAEAPDTVTPAIVISAADYTAAYGATLGEVTTFEGYEAKLVKPNPAASDAHLAPQVDKWNYHGLSNKITFPRYKYVGITYYYDGKGSGTAKSIAMQLDQLNTAGWVQGSANFPSDISPLKRPIIEGKWVTQYFDFSAFAEKAGQLYPGQYLKQARHYPFGNETAAKNYTGNEESWFNSITFSQRMPMYYNANGEKIDYNDGSSIVYVSSTGSATVDGKTVDAYTTFPEAIDALSPVGGIIRLSGEMEFVDNAAEHSKIIIEGADSNAKLTNTIITLVGGDVELRNIKMVGTVDENWSYTNGHVLTLGEGFTVDNTIRPGMPISGKATSLNMYSGKLGNFGAAALWQGTFTVTGNSVYNIYGGDVTGSIDGFSRNGNGKVGIQTVNGNVEYNLYGGNFKGGLYTATTTGILNGNLIYNINGGKFASGQSFAFGTSQSYDVTDTKYTKVNGNQIFIINNKQIVQNSGSLAGISIGVKQGVGITNSDAGKFVILNNAEYAGNTGAAIHASNVADYAISVSRGSATPVFAEDGITLKGFAVIPDSEELVPYLDGEKLVADANGLYQLEAKTGTVQNIVFNDPAALDILFKDGEKATTVSAKQNGTVTIPESLLTKDGYIFAGWKTDGDDNIYIPGESYALGIDAITFTAQWMAKADLKTIYVNPQAEASGSGVVRKSPVKSFPEAQNIIGDYSKDFTIILMGEISIGSYGHCFSTSGYHNGRITVDGEGVGSIKYVDAFYPLGPVTLQNLNLKITKSNNFFDGSNRVDGLVIGENVKNIAASETDTTVIKPKIHLGAQNANSIYQNLDMHSSSVATLFAGPYYVSNGKSVTSAGARIYIDGGNIAEIRFVADTYGTSLGGSVTWTNAPSLVIAGEGSVSKATFASKSIPAGETAHTEKYVTYQYPAQLVLNDGITSVPSGFDASKHIIIKSGVDGTVDVTETPGVFSIKTDSDTLYINGVLAEKTVNDLYTINTPGIYTVSYSSVNVEYAPGMDDVQGENVTETVVDGYAFTLAQNTFARDGFEFVGWFDGENHYAAGASYTATENVKFTPVWKNSANNRAYISASAYVDTNGDGRVDLKPFNAMGETINSITAAEGGTIYVCGYYNGGLVETTKATRGPITFCGLDNNASANKLDLENTSNVVFNKNDVTFDNLTIKAPKDELFISTDSGRTITFGANLKVEVRECIYETWRTNRYLYVGSHGAATGTSNYIINGGDFSFIMSGGNYNSTTAHVGDVYYTVNGGVFREYYGGSRNGSGKNGYNTNGNVYHTINGGTFTTNVYLGSHVADKVSGNVIFTVNGGNFKNKSIIGGHVNYAADAPMAGKNAAVIVNNKNVGADDDFTGLVLGRKGYGNNIGGHEIYIINNAEINTGVKIHAESIAAYRIRVTGGSATPVFAEGVGGDLLGFDLVSDIDGVVPVCGGNVLTKNAYGYYSLASNNVAGSFCDISFAKAVSIGGSAAMISDNYTVTASADGAVDFENSAVPYVQGEIFLGWYHENGVAVANGETIRAGAVIKAEFTELNTTYGDENANFVVEGAQIRLNGVRALRFVNSFGKELMARIAELTEGFAPTAETDNGIGYGYVVLPENLLENEKLTKETQKAGIVPAVKTYKDYEDRILYTVCITSITDYTCDYAVVPYITYTDAQGYEHTVYGEQYSTNMAAIASMALDREELTQEQTEALKVIAGR
ncbi:MAG: InlB B-repeat-containing protein [Clostridia bacterium]|nr:InlB B-repeat-containing protein [Clostridia bacterium]